MHSLKISLITLVIIILPTIVLGQKFEKNLRDNSNENKSDNRKGFSDTTDKLKFENLLQQVTIIGKRDSRQDSLNRREWFKKEFNYKSPTFYDALTSRKPSGNSGDLISVNPLTLITILTKKKNKQSKLQQTLIKDEQAEFIGRKFNKALIGNITGLKGDSLLAFLALYQPAYNFCQTASSYDMLIYTRQKLNIFRKNKNAIMEYSINPFK